MSVIASVLENAATIIRSNNQAEAKRLLTERHNQLIELYIIQKELNNVYFRKRQAAYLMALACLNVAAAISISTINRTQYGGCHRR